MSKMNAVPPELVNWLAGGAIVGAFSFLWWIAKRWINGQAEQIALLQKEIRMVDGKKLDVDAFNGWSQRLLREQKAQFERLIDEQRTQYDQHKDATQRQSEKLEEIARSTQTFNLQVVERLARLERD